MPRDFVPKVLSLKEFRDKKGSYLPFKEVMS